MWSLIVLSVLSGFGVSVLVTWLMLRLAPRLGLLDKPGVRKVHSVPTPMGGGVGIWLGVLLPLAGAQLAVALVQHGMISIDWVPGALRPHLEGIAWRAPQLWAILLGGTVLVTLGLLDDLHNLRWQPRLLVQLLVACGVVAGGVRGSAFLSMAGLGGGLTVLWIVVMTNSFNFLDNMDGLSGGIALIVSVMFAVIMLIGGPQPHWFVAAFLLILAGSLAGFLMFNWPPAKIFMGDAGSNLIGMWLGCLVVVGTFYEYDRNSRHVILAPLCVLAVPLYDFCSVVLIRLLQGRSPFHADKSHFSHRLVELGLSRHRAVLTIHLVTLTTGIGGLLLYQVSGWGGACLILLMVACLLAVIAILETAGRRKSARLEREQSDS